MPTLATIPSLILLPSLATASHFSSPLPISISLSFVLWLTEFNKDCGESCHMALAALVCDSMLAIPLKTATPSLLSSVKRYWFLRDWKDPVSSLIYDLLFIDLVLYRPKADELILCSWLQLSCYVQKRALHGLPLLYPLSILFLPPLLQCSPSVWWGDTDVMVRGEHSPVNCIKKLLWSKLDNNTCLWL